MFNARPISFGYSLLLSLIFHLCVFLFLGLSLPQRNSLKKMEFVVSLQSNDAPKVNVQQATEVAPVSQPVAEQAKRLKKKIPQPPKHSLIKEIEKSQELATQAPPDSKPEDAPASNQEKNNTALQQSTASEKSAQTQSPVKIDKKVKDDYGDILGRHIAKFKYYPKYAEMHRIQGRVILELIFDEAGQLISTQVSKSSGDSLLDAAAKDMVKKSLPLPLPMGSLKNKSFSMYVPIEFLLN